MSRQQQPDRYVYNSNGKDPSEPHPQSAGSTIFSHLRKVSSKKKGVSRSEELMSRSNNKQVLVIDDDYDSALTVKSCPEIWHRQNTEESAASEFQPIQVIRGSFTGDEGIQAVLLRSITRRHQHAPHKRL
jgi:hypothetical protein